MGKIGDFKIPALLVATGCENREPMQAWVEENRHIFVEYDMKYKDIICTCFAEGGRLESHFQELRGESRANVLAAIFRNASDSPIILYRNDSEFRRFFKNLWNGLVELLELPKDWKAMVDEQIVNLLTRMGISNEKAERIAQLWRK